jgi:hypothetical protein
MDDLSKQEVEFIEDGLVDTGDTGLLFIGKHFASGVPTRIEVYKDTRPKGNEVRQDDEGKVELITVNVKFLGHDDNGPHGIRLTLSPELATVIANAMLTHASSLTGVEVVSTTLIQGYDDYIAEKEQTDGHDRWW